MDTPLGLPALPHRVARQGRPDSLRGQRSSSHSVRPGAERRWELGIRGTFRRGSGDRGESGCRLDLGPRCQPVDAV